MRKFSSILLLLCTLWNTGTVFCEVTVTGELSILGDTNISDVSSLRPAKVDVGDEVRCHFQLMLNNGADLRSVKLVFNTTGLEFPKKSPERFVEIRWASATFQDPALLEKRVTTSVDFETDNTQLIIQADINGVPVTSISGTYSLVVSEKTRRIGSGQSFMTAMPRLLSGDMISAIYVYSTLIVTPLPLFDIKRADPFLLQMRELTTVHFELNIPPGTLTDSYSKVYLPYDEKNNEAMMTVKKVRVQDVTGITFKHDLLGTIHTTQSRTQSSEADMATLMLPEVDTPTNTTIVVHADAQLLDFIGFKDGSVLEICVGVKLNDDAIWMGRSYVTISEGNTTAAELIPNLDINLSESQRYVENKKVHYRMRLTMVHNDSSSASAYEVSAFVYFPSHVMTLEKSIRKVYDGIKPYSVTGDDGKLKFDLKRISFPVSTKLMINLTLDTVNATYTEDRKLILLYDVVYKSWRRRKDYSTSTKYFELSIPNLLDDQNVPVPHKCPCPGEPKRTNCSCCTLGNCPCASRYGDKCVSCQQMWMCRNILPEYLMYAILPEANGGGFWACNNSANPHDWRPFVPCMFASENFQEIRPLPNTVATILGQDMTSGYLYGINNNGLGYVYSRNGGHNWISIPENVYIRAFNLPDFRMATLI